MCLLDAGNFGDYIGRRDCISHIYDVETVSSGTQSCNIKTTARIGYMVYPQCLKLMVHDFSIGCISWK